MWAAELESGPEATPDSSASCLPSRPSRSCHHVPLAEASREAPSQRHRPKGRLTCGRSSSAMDCETRRPRFRAVRLRDPERDYHRESGTAGHLDSRRQFAGWKTINQSHPDQFSNCPADLAEPRLQWRYTESRRGQTSGSTHCGRRNASE